MKSEKLASPTALHLDTVNQCLWLGNHNVALTPKTFLVLRYLMDRPGQLVTKEELLNAAWPEVYVSDAALKVCIRRLRQTLGDESHIPRFIETIPWRGYRFIGEINNLLPLETGARGPEIKVQSSEFKIQGPDATEAGHFSDTDPHPPRLVGRDATLSQLHSLLLFVLQGRQQTVLLTGEPGIGKTAVIDAFLARVAGDDRVWVVSGQCIEHYGTGEPYFPILEAVERLCHLPGNERFVAVLRQYAPMWLVQMPSLISAAEQKRLRRALQGTTSDRMLREFADALTYLTAEKPLVLMIEDLHWSDSATLDLLSYLTRRHQHSRLLFVGTYRPGVVTEPEHPLLGLIRELSTHGRCHTMALGFLDEDAVLAYVTNRFPSYPSLRALAKALHQRTEGNPLFIVNIIEYLLTQGFLRQENGQWQLHVRVDDIHTMVPSNVRQLIEMQIDRLSQDEQQLLEAASIAGVEFSAAAVAAAANASIPAVEEQYTKLARRSHFLRSLRSTEWPDGTVAQQYAFIHSLYQETLYQRIPAGKRVQMHSRIGLRKELAYGAQAGQIAVKLAVHFERGHDFRRAVQYRRHAAETALQRYAYREAIEHCTIGLELLNATPASEEHTQQEIALCSALGTALTATQGYASVAVERTYSRAYALWRHAGSTSPPFPILLGLWGFSQVRAELQTAFTQAQQLLEAALATQDPQHVSLAHNALGSTCFWQGKLIAARQHYECSLTSADLAQTGATDFVETPGVLARSSLSVIFLHLGELALAHAHASRALALAEEQGHHYSLAMARCHTATMHQVNRNFLATQEMAAAAIALATEKGFPYCLASSTIQHGWARAMLTNGQEGIEQIAQGLAAYHATGAVVWRAYFLSLLAEAQLVAGQTAECFRTVTEGLALAHARGQVLPEADLYRIKGELLLAQESKNQRLKTKKQKAKSCDSRPPAPDPQAEAEGYFLKSVEIARRQQAGTLEFRAVIRLSQLWQLQGKDDRARQTLTPLYERLSGGHSSADLQEARALLRPL
jgi:predicted ATPase/DNA-binding winged helix-turn-helix (wHTH) protein